MKRYKEIFLGGDKDKVSSKRTIGIIIIFILIVLWLDNHFVGSREINMKAFDIMATLAGALLIGGVADGFLRRRYNNDRHGPSPEPGDEEEYK